MGGKFEMKHVSVEPDGILIERTRAGDRGAYAELWRRHSGAALTVARSSSTFDADDLVAEAFAKVFAAIRAGGGPTGAFRPYLFTTVRNVAASWGRAAQPVPIDDLDEIEDPTTSEDEMLAALDRSTTARAFRTLPTRWQEVLWYTEVESMSPRHVAPLVGMKANAVAALAVRAREGLRQAWITAHLASASTTPECRSTIERLAAYTRGSLGARATAKVAEHLEGCAPCQIVAEEANRVSSRLALVLLPLVAGVAGAGAYLASAQRGVVVAAGAAGWGASTGLTGAAGTTGVAGTTGAAGMGGAAGMAAPAPAAARAQAPAGVGADSRFSVSAGGGPATGSIAGLVAAGVAVLAGAGVAVALLAGANWGGGPGGGAEVAQSSPQSQAQPDTSTTDQSDSKASAPAGGPPSGPGNPADPITTPPRAPSTPDAPDDDSTQTLTADPARVTPPSTAALPSTAAPAAPSGPAVPPGPTRPADPTDPGPPPAPRAALQPGPTSVYPRLSGTALAGAQVVVTLTSPPVADDTDSDPAVTDSDPTAATQWTTTADPATGAWTLTLDGIRVGDSEVVATQTVDAPVPPLTIRGTSSQSAPVHVTLDAPPTITVEALAQGFFLVSVHGVSNATVRLYHDELPAFQSSDITLNVDGNWSGLWSAPTDGFFVRSVDGARVGAVGRAH